MLQTFQPYISYKRDNNELLLYLLQKLVAAATKFLATVKGIDDPHQVEIPMEDFETRVRTYV